MSINQWIARMNRLTLIASQDAIDAYKTIPGFSDRGWDYKFDTSRSVLCARYLKNGQELYREFDKPEGWKDAARRVDTSPAPKDPDPELRGILKLLNGRMAR